MDRNVQEEKIKGEDFRKNVKKHLIYAIKTEREWDALCSKKVFFLNTFFVCVCGGGGHLRIESYILSVSECVTFCLSLSQDE